MRTADSDSKIYNVWLAAPKHLYRTHYGVREQFPAEVEEKKKGTLPQYNTSRQEFRQNRNIVVGLLRDKLYVNGKEVVVDHRDKSLGLNENSYMRSDKQRTSNMQHQVQ